jgi:uncharacterized protein YlxW (UPF0749 family)
VSQGHNNDFSTTDLNSLVILAAVLAIVIAKGKTTEEMNIIGNFLSTAGTALTILGSVSQPEDNPPEPVSLTANMNDLQQQLNQLKQQIEQFEQKLQDLSS